MDGDREIFGLGSETILPSNGLLYDGKVPDGRVQILPMTTREEKMIASSGSGAAATAVDTLITRCVRGLNGVAADDLVVGDRLHLIMAIRAVSLGDDYEFSIRCESCNAKFKSTVKIPDDLTTLYLKKGFEEPFKVELPVSGALLKLRLLRGKDEKDIAKYSERASKNASRAEDQSYTYRIVKQIASMNLTPDDSETEIINDTPEATRKLMDIYDTLQVKDSVELRNVFSENDCGVDTNLEHNCPKCNAYFDASMPMQIEFFRPGGNRGIRYL